MNRLDHLFSTGDFSDPILGKIVLLETYDETYGIAQHGPEDSPLSLVLMKDSEDTTTYSRLHGTALRFAEAKIGQHFNISYTEYMKLPREYTELLYEVSVRLENQSHQSGNAAKKELDDLLNT